MVFKNAVSESPTPESIAEKIKGTLKVLQQCIIDSNKENNWEKKWQRFEKKKYSEDIQERINNTFNEISSNFSEIFDKYWNPKGQPELVKLSWQKIEFVDFTIEQYPNPKFKNVYYLKTNVKYIENGEEKHSTIGFLVDYSQPEGFIYEIKWDPNNTSSVDDFDLWY